MAREEHNKKLKHKKETDGDSVIADGLPDITEEEFKTSLRQPARKINPTESDQPRTVKDD